jgi:hypothetical protein
VNRTDWALLLSLIRVYRIEKPAVDTGEVAPSEFPRLLQRLELLGPAYLLSKASDFASSAFYWRAAITSLSWDNLYESGDVVDNNREQLLDQFSMAPMVGEPQRTHAHFEPRGKLWNEAVLGEVLDSGRKKRKSKDLAEAPVRKPVRSCTHSG